MSEHTDNTEKNIEINDLPPEEPLTPEEKERLAGAGRRAYQPTLEALEARQMMDAGIGGALTASMAPTGGGAAPAVSHVRTLASYGLASPTAAPATTVDLAIDLTQQDLSGLDLTKADLSSVDLAGKNLSGCILTGVDLSNRDLSNTILSGADLTGANLNGANMWKTVLSSAEGPGGSIIRTDLTGATLRGADLYKTDLSGAILTDAKFSAEPGGMPTTLTGVNLSGADLRDADLSNVKLGGNSNDLSKADLRGTILYGADLRSLNLRGADLREQNLTEADLSESDLSEAYMTDTILNGANLTDASLTDANLARAQLGGTTLSGTNLTRTNLKDANLTGTNLTEATLEGTTMLGANLTNANLSGLDLRRGKLTTSPDAVLSTNPLLGCTLTGANLSKVDLSETDLSQMDLSNLNLRGALLVNTKFVEHNMTSWDFAADLQGADLREADLRGADLGWTDLRLADLRDADLRGANLKYADREGTDLRGADLTGADVSSMTLKQAQMAFLLKAFNESTVKTADALDFSRIPIMPTHEITDILFVPREESGEPGEPTTENDLVRVRPELSLPSLGTGVDVLGGGIDANGNLIPGASDSSAATVYTTAAGEKFLFVGGDEDQSIRMYKFDVVEREYKFVKHWDYTKNLGLTDRRSDGTFREVDIEGVTMSGDKLYWIGSGSNRKAAGQNGGDAYKDAPNRDRIFRTDITEVNGQPELTFVGYTRIEEALIAQVPGLKEAARGDVNPKTTAGYNIEGLVNLPDEEMGIAFRASGTEKALIVPVTNLDAMITRNAPAEFAENIELDLGGRGIRDIMGSTYKDADGATRRQYLIIAGPAGAATGIGNDDFRLYTWTGDAADKPVMHAANLLGMTPEGIVLPEGNAKWDANTEFGLISDNGATMFDDNILGKDQAPLDKKSRIDYVKLGEVTDGHVFKELTGTRRQDNLEGAHEFTFTASGSTGFIEVLGPGRNTVKIEVGYATSDDAFVKVAESKYEYKTDTNLVYLAQLPEGMHYTVRLTPVPSPGPISSLTVGSFSEVYTLSWKV